MKNTDCVTFSFIPPLHTKGLVSSERFVNEYEYPIILILIGELDHLRTTPILWIKVSLTLHHHCIFREFCAFHFLDVSLPVLHEKFEENGFPVDASFFGDYFVYKATLTNHSDTCPLACIFDSKCLYYFVLDTPQANCFIGNFKESESNSPEESYRRYRERHNHNRAFHFIPSTFVRLMTKGRGLNITSSIVKGLFTRLHQYHVTSGLFGLCQGAKIHVVTDPNWTLSLSLVYISGHGRGACHFTILKLIEGKMKLTIPDPNVRFFSNRSILYLCQLHSCTNF